MSSEHVRVCWAVRLRVASPRGAQYLEAMQKMAWEDGMSPSPRKVRKILRDEFGITIGTTVIGDHFRRECKCVTSKDSQKTRSKTTTS